MAGTVIVADLRSAVTVTATPLMVAELILFREAKSPENSLFSASV